MTVYKLELKSKFRLMCEGGVEQWTVNPFVPGSSLGQGAILNNQDIFGCLFLCLKKPAIKGFYKILFF